MAIKLFNTLTKKEQEFEPINPSEVRMYHCGPTVYDYAHIGNLRSYVFADILRRSLGWSGYETKQVINITDVGHLVTDGDSGEDKMMKALKREGKEVTLENMKEIALKFEEAFKGDLEKLNIKTPDYFPRASEHIKENIELIKALEEKGFIYQTSDGIYFDTSKDKKYGKLGGLSEEVESRIESTGEKKNPRDFALWKFSDELGWDTPWGKGFPGWHVECSAMSQKYLGQPFDIHTGGIDHIPVHHNNEIAQSENAYEKPLANVWMHNAFLTIDEERMAKSSGNIYTLNTIEEKGFSPLAYRYLLLQSHYRSPVNFSWEALEASEKALRRLKLQIQEIPDGGIAIENKIKEFQTTINDDLGTPQALAVLWDILRDADIEEEDKKATILKMDEVLGLDLSSPLLKEEIEIPDEIQKLTDDREAARGEGDFQKADKLRKEIEDRGYSLKDTSDGVQISKI